jgi:Phage integrase, N-terminal SAM-like domain
VTNGGTTTQSGKAVVRWNATRHGISSPAPVVPGLERTADWDEHRDGLLESLRPEGHLETVLAERVALLFWRLHRVTRYESGAIATLYGKTRQEVATKLSKALADREGGFTFDAGATTVEEYLARWLSHSVRDTVSQKTYERYESIVRVHLNPALGRIKLKVLTPGHVRGLYREKLDAGLAPRTVLHIHRTLSKALKQATDDGLIPRNAAASVKPPRPRSEEMQPLSRDQVQTFLDTVRGDRIAVACRRRAAVAAS